MQAAKRIAVNTGFLYARMGITVFISLYATRLVLAALGVKDFGILNIVGGAIAMLGFLNASMTEASQRFMSYAQGSGDSSQLNKIFNISIALHLLIAVLLFIVLEVIGFFLFKGVINISLERIEAAKLVYHFMVISTLFTVISVPYDAVINANEHMLVFAILGIIESVSKLLIALYITFISEDKLVVYGILMAVLSLILYIIRCFYCQIQYKECKLNLKTSYDKRLAKEMGSFAGWSFLGSSTSMISNYGQGIVINIFFGTIVNAAQGIANQVSGQLSAFAVTLLKALNPLIDKSEGAGDRSLMLKASMIGSKVSFFLLMFFYIPVLIEMPYIFKLWLKFVPDYAIVFCRLLLARNLIDQLFVTLNSSVLAVGNIKKYQIYRSFLNFLPLPISYFLFTLQYPVYSLYIVFIAYSLLKSSLTLFFASKNCNLPISLFLKDVIIKCTAIFIILFIASYIPKFLIKEGIIRFVLVSIISTIGFVLTIWLWGITPDERTRIKQMLSPLYYKISAKGVYLKTKIKN